ncbi:MAG: hypothetical protein ABI382_02575 [Nakamurella sp.]
MVWVYVAGGALLVVAALVPTLTLRRGNSREEGAAAQEGARSAMSRLEAALDAPPGASAASARAEAERCLTLAGAALGGRDTVAKFRRAQDWAERGLAALGALES